MYVTWAGGICLICTHSASGVERPQTGAICMYIENVTTIYQGRNLNWRLGKVRQNCQLLAFVHEALARPPPIKNHHFFLYTEH